MPRTTPDCALNGVDYLCLKMFLNPGRSQRYYRRALAVYTRGPSEIGTPHNYVPNGMYFRRGGRYRDVLWKDLAPGTVIDHMPFHSSRMKPKVSAMTLTKEGLARAHRAAVEIGMDIDFGYVY